MSPFAVSLSFFAVLSVVCADVSHLQGYQYPKQSFNEGTGSLQLHSPTTQHVAPYPTGQGNLPNSYAPAPSGSPYASRATLASSQSTLSLSPPSTYVAQGSLSNANYQPQVSTQSYQQPPLQVQHQQPVQQSQQHYQQASQQHYQQAPQQQYQQTSQQHHQQAPQQQYQQASQQHYQQAPQQQYQHASHQTATQSAHNYNSVKSPLEPIVTKNFYVHSAPEEPEEETGPRYVPVGRSHKSYKIIFIKAPAYNFKNEVIPVLPQNEEKTIVYVLSKKPELDQHIHVPEPIPTEPTKPEVFFVKYKTQEEAERAQKQIQDAYNQSGDQSAVDLRGVFSNADSAGSTLTLGGQESSQHSQYAGVHYLSPDANRRRRFA